MLLSVACLTVSHFSTLSYKRHDFQGEKLLTIKCVFGFSQQILSEKFLILRRICPDIFTNFLWYSCNVPIFFCQILINLEFSRQTFDRQMSNSMDFRPVGAELFHADGRTDITKLIVAFRNFAKEPKMLPTRSQIWLEVSKLNHKLVPVFKHHAALS
jgi:hypothetical protein